VQGAPPISKDAQREMNDCADADFGFRDDAE